MAPSAPPAYQLSILDQQNIKNMQKHVGICKDGDGQIFQKSQANQPNQGHQPAGGWMSQVPVFRSMMIALVTLILIF